MIPAAGAMRERVTIQKESRADDGGGGSIISWSDVATVWAEIKPVSVSDNIRALALALSITHKVNIRYRADVAALASDRFRLLWNGVVLNIRGASNPDQNKRFLELTCESGQMEAK